MHGTENLKYFTFICLISLPVCPSVMRKAMKAKKILLSVWMYNVLI
jgi:hypothetical protein